MGMGLLGGGRLVPGQEGEAALQAMAKDGKPQFEVATIRAADPANQNQGFHTRGRRILVENERVSDVVAVAYGVHRAQIVDAPAWFDRERYDIEGVPDLPGYPDLPQMQGMLRRLLEERFGLQLRREQRELPVYAMTVGKGGAKLKKSAGDPSGLPDQTGHGEGEQQVVRFTNCAMSDVALEMQGFLERPVVDQTGLPGRYDFTLRWTPSLAAVPLSAEVRRRRQGSLRRCRSSWACGCRR